MKFLGRFGTRLVGFLVFLAPMTALAVIGVDYFINCLLYLSAPGESLVLPIQTENGIVTLKTGPYSIDAFAGFIKANDVEIVDSQGVQLARAKTARLYAPGYLNIKDSAVRVDVSEVFATIERDSLGELSFFKYFKPAPPEDRPIPVRVHVTDGRLRFIDNYTYRRHELEVTIPILDFATAENAWKAQGNLIGFGGSIDIDAQMTAKMKLSVKGRANKFDLAQLWPYIQDLKEVRANQEAQLTTASVAIIDGPFEATWGKKEGFAMSGDPDVAVKEFVTPHWGRPFDATYKGTANSFRATGKLAADDGLNRADFEGQLVWENGFSMRGVAHATSPSLDAIPARYRTELPRGLTARNIDWQGPIRIVPDQPVTLGGDTRVDELRLGKETFTDIDAKLTTDDWLWTADIGGARWRNTVATGAIQWNQRSGAIGGFVESSSVDLGTISRVFLKQNIQGTGAVKATLGGTVEKPRVALRANGSTTIDLKGELGRRRAIFEGAATIDGSILKVSRALITSGNGTIIADGQVDLNRQTLDLRLRGAGIQIADWLKDSGGLATLAVQVTGPFDSPQATGKVELLNAMFQDQVAPLMVAKIAVEKKRILINDIGAVRGASRLDGEVAIDWKSGRIEGNVQGQGLQLSDFLGEEFSGSINVRKVDLGGTLENPIAIAVADAKDLVIQGVRIDSITANARLDGNLLNASAIEVLAGPGSWHGSAQYNMRAKNGRMNGEAKNLDLGTLVPVLANDFVLDGTVAAKTEATWIEGKLRAASIEGQVDKLQVNPTIIGSGTFSAKLENQTWTGTAEIGQPERYIQIPEFTYAASGENIDAQIVTAGIPIHDVFLAIRPKLVSASLEPRPGKISVPEKALSILDSLDGAVNTFAVIQGDPDDPTVKLESLEFADLSISGEKSGSVNVIATRAPRGKWDIPRFEWSGGPGILTASGKVDEHGEASIEGDLNNFKPSWLALFDGRFANVSGYANAHFFSEGPVAEPKIIASLDAFLFEQKKPEADRNSEPQYNLTANVGPITIDKRGILFEGDFEARGIRGGLDGRLPFEYPFAVPSDKTMAIDISVPRRRSNGAGGYHQDRLDLAPFAKDIETIRIGGDRHDLQANVHLGGTIENLALSGQAVANVGVFGVTGIETELRNLVANIDFDGDKLTLTANANSNFTRRNTRPGTMALQTSLNLPDNFQILDGDMEALWESTVSGQIDLDHFRIKETDAESGGAADVIVAAKLKISGNAKEPLISTESPATLEQLTASMPTVFPEPKQTELPTFNPRFAIDYLVGDQQDPASIKAITANFDLFGAGAITGSLTELNATANLTVDRGAIRLPNARVTIEENGEVRFIFRGNEGGPGDIRLDVDLVGHTSLSSVRPGGTVQRYDVNLNIKGNLLDESSQFITARSDPPDLDQAQILNMLGQRELFEGLASQFVGERSSQAITQMLAGAALPVLLDPFTQKLAQELGLEFIQLDYTAFEGASITAAKSLGKGFMFQGRRQLQEGFDGRIHFDYRLTWRPPSRLKQLRNLIFSVGADQDRPWKIAVEYGIRF